MGDSRRRKTARPKLRELSASTSALLLSLAVLSLLSGFAVSSWQILNVPHPARRILVLKRQKNGGGSGFSHIPKKAAAAATKWMSVMFTLGA